MRIEIACRVKMASINFEQEIKLHLHFVANTLFNEGENNLWNIQ